ncbi:MAG: transcriptional regulator [marine bacterium B5-7]|nr:MAG: transcriptional regulator [marine bacterium B5-7]
MIINSPEYYKARKALDTSDLFSKCGDNELAALLNASYFRKVQRNRNIYLADDIAREAFLLLSGGVKLCTPVKNKRDKVIQIVRPMDLLGIFDILTDGQRDLSAYAISPCELLMIDGDILTELISGNTHFCTQILMSLGMRYKETSSWCFRYNHYGAREKVAAYLVTESRREYAEDDSIINPSRRDIASLLGITPETLSRELSFFKKHEWVRVDPKGVIQVVNSESLSELFNP